MQPTGHRICVVDDDAGICSLLDDLFTERGHTVMCARDGRQALSAMETWPADMVITDIQMPLMNGFELLAAVEERFPRTKRVLMTGCDIDEYLSIIREHQIGNILSKSSDFRFEAIIRYIEMLLSGDVFGLDKVFNASLIRSCSVRSEGEAQAACRQIVEQYGGSDKVYVEMAVNELVANAVFHAVLDLSTSARDQWNDQYVLDGQRPIVVSWARDEEKIGVSVEDPAGRLRKRDVLRWLDKRLAQGGQCEEHGRGLLLVRRLIDRFIINIDQGQRTECILLHYGESGAPTTSKPILIHEL